MILLTKVFSYMVLILWRHKPKMITRMVRMALLGKIDHILVGRPMNTPGIAAMPGKSTIQMYSKWRSNHA